MNEHNKTETVIYTENKQVVARGEEGRWRREIGEGETCSCKVNESRV